MGYPVEQGSDAANKMIIVAFGLGSGVFTENEKVKLKKWLTSRLGTSNLKIYYEVE